MRCPYDGDECGYGYCARNGCRTLAWYRMPKSTEFKAMRPSSLKIAICLWALCVAIACAVWL